jgi:hypothetical protein
MNMKEGFRRVGLILGLAGMIGGAIVAYWMFLDVLEQRTKSRAFFELMNSPAVKDALATFGTGDPNDGIMLSTEHQDVSTLRFGSMDGVHTEVTALEMKGGEVLYRRDPPSGFWYVLPFLLPMCGFAIPWALMRILVWVGSGFRRVA